AICSSRPSSPRQTGDGYGSVCCALSRYPILPRLAGVTSIWDKANPQLRELAVYEPGKPIEETARELEIDPGEIIKLASNENPLGPSPKAVMAMRDTLG